MELIKVCPLSTNYFSFLPTSRRNAGFLHIISQNYLLNDAISNEHIYFYKYILDRPSVTYDARKRNFLQIHTQKSNKKTTKEVAILQIG